VIAGAAAALAWKACDPLLKRAFGTPYADAEVAGPVLHVAAGAAFGHVFERLGGHGARQGIAAALAENTVLWPGMLVLDRVHPRRRDGTWPPLFASPRVFLQASAGHALFGAVLGSLVGAGRPSSYTGSRARSPRHLE
jgi:hypothetical protein